MISALSILLFSDLTIETIIREGGLLIICLAVFAQTGLFFCFFLPSSIFIFTGGMFIATGQLEQDVITVCICAIGASVLGGITGYCFGWGTGPLLYHKKDSKFFKQQYLEAAGIFYKKYGKPALALGMLFPVIRTFAPVVAGIVKMGFWQFVLFLFIGSTLWITGFVVSGYLIGTIPAIEEYRNYIMVAIVLAVTIPAVVRITRSIKKAGKGFNNQNLE